ncbi:MAG: hypothetical protein RL885_07810 [Planctomycetota bacterium]
MNFFAHLVVAAREDRSEAFLLGAMLPDFGSMARFKVVAPADASLRAGVTCHHATDEIFHSRASFLEHQSRGAEALRALGLRAAHARGVAHLGVELLLDGELARLDDERALFRRALEQGVEVDIDGDAQQRWQGLRRRLLDGTLPSAYRDPDFVADRLVGICARRPKLVIPGEVAEALPEWTRGMQHHVSPWAEEIVEEVVALRG